MYGIYQSEVNGVKLYYRAGTNPLTNQYEFYISLFDEATKKERWQFIPIQCTHYIPDTEYFFQFTISEGSFIVYPQTNSILLDNVIYLNSIDYTLLPTDLLKEHLEHLNDIARYQSTLNSPQSSPVNINLNENRSAPKSRLNLNMQILGLFAGVVGAIVVCTALIIMHLVSMGTFSIILGVGLGIAAAGIGLFGTGHYRDKRPPEPIALENDLCINY